MDENWLQIRKYEGEGFQPLVAFDSWRVGVLNYLDAIRLECNNKAGGGPELSGRYPPGM